MTLLQKVSYDTFYNLQGQTVVNRHVDTRSYASLHSLVTAMFPAIFSCEQVRFSPFSNL